MLALPVYDRAERTLGAIPALVAIHRVVAARHGGDAIDRQLGQVVHRRVRRDVPAVGEGMNPRLVRREPQQRLEVIDVRVHAAVRDETEQMDALATLERATHSLVLEEIAALDRPVHTHEILEEDAARADREVSHLGIAHLTVRQADGLTRGVELGVRVVVPEPVEDRSVRKLDRVARPGWRDSPTVEDDERYEGIRAAASHIAVKEWTSRDAPPTRAPSTSGCAKSPSALSGLTDPP